MVSGSIANIQGNEIEPAKEKNERLKRTLYEQSMKPRYQISTFSSTADAAPVLDNFLQKHYLLLRSTLLYIGYLKISIIDICYTNICY